MIRDVGWILGQQISDNLANRIVSFSCSASWTRNKYILFSSFMMRVTSQSIPVLDEISRMCGLEPVG